MMLSIAAIWHDQILFFSGVGGRGNVRTKWLWRKLDVVLKPEIYHSLMPPSRGARSLDLRDSIIME
jgi:hypothetical protein